MEEAAPDRGAEVPLGERPGEEQEERRRLDHDGEYHHAAEQAADVALRHAHQLHAEEVAAAETELAADEQDQHPRVHRHAEPAELDEDGDHQLAEEVEMLRRVEAHQPGDADGRCRGEEGVSDVRPVAGVGDDGEREEQRTDGDHEREGGRDHPRPRFDGATPHRADAHRLRPLSGTADDDVAREPATESPHPRLALSRPAPRGRRSSAYARAVLGAAGRPGAVR